MHYPIIHLFPGDKNIYAQQSGPEYGSVSLLDKFKNSIILDSKGNKYLVGYAIKIGWAYFFGYHPFLKGRTAKIAYKFLEEEKLSLSQYKKIIIDKLLGGVAKGFWYSEKEIPILIDKVNNSLTYNSVIECFMKDLY